jgi:hypothetical protein
MYKQESKPSEGIKESFLGTLTTVKKRVNIQKMSDGIF